MSKTTARPLTAQKWPVEVERLRQVLNVSDPLVHGSGEVVCVVQASQDNAGEVDGLCEVTHQRALDPYYVPPERRAAVRGGVQREEALLLSHMTFLSLTTSKHRHF